MVDTYIANNIDMFFSSIVIALAIAGTIISTILIISWYILFEKNKEKGWKAIVPIYNIYILMKIANINPFCMLLLFIPIINLFVFARISVEIANHYDKSALFAVGLFFFPFLFYPILSLSIPKEPKQDPKQEKIDVENDEQNMEQDIEEETKITKEKIKIESFSPYKTVVQEKEENKEEKEELRKEPPEKSKDLNEEVDKLLKIMKKINKEEEEKEEKEEAIKESTICESCGAIIPRFSKKCLLCGSTKKEKENL